MKLFAACLFLLSAASLASAQDWQLVWSDEFDTPGAPNAANWTYDLGASGWGNQERQNYTDRLENARVEDGALVIEAREEALGGAPYTSARLVTRGLQAWTYGRIEARIQLPQGQGIWPAFWMLPTDSPYGGWPTSGEIDIMEFLGHDTDQSHGTIHYGGGSIGHQFSGQPYTLPSGTFPETYHTFAIEWEPQEIRWYVNDTHFATRTGWSSAAAPYPAPFDQPFHLLLNVAVGGVWPGYPDETTVFPQRMLVDYVRVFQDATAAPSVALTATPPASVLEGATVGLEVEASDPDGIDRVEFLQAGGVLAVDEQAPYEWSIEGAESGCYSLSARAVDADGYESVTEPIEVVVGDGCPDGSRAPFGLVAQPIPGRIEAEAYDLGGDGVAYRDLTDANTGAGGRPDEGVDLSPSRDSGGGVDVADINAREWVTYSVDIAEAGDYNVIARIASASGGRLRLSLDGDVLLDGDLSQTGSDPRYGNARLGQVTLPAGRHVLRVDMRSAGFALNWLSFTRAGATSRPDGPEPLGVRLEAPAPAPARGRARAAFVLAEPGHVRAELFNALGQRVAVLEDGPRSAGDHVLEVDASGLPTGAYVVRLVAGGSVVTQRMTVAR